MVEAAGIEPASPTVSDSTQVVARTSGYAKSNTRPDDARCLQRCPDARLGRLIAAWETLPENIRVAIGALVGE